MAKGPKREDDADSESKKKTPPKKRTFNSIKDIRSEKKSGAYPNQQVIKTRSGHTVSYDDSQDNESMTIQHRSGAGIQFLPNGAIQMTSHNGKYEVVFGENRMTITGANDISVKGDGSLRIYGDYRKTVHGNIEYSATESVVMRGKNIIHTASENHSIVSQTITHKASDAVQISSNKHVSVIGENTAVVGRDSAHLGAKRLALMGKNKVSVKSSDGSMEVAAKTTFDKTIGEGGKISYGKGLEQTVGEGKKEKIGGDRNTQVAGDTIDDFKKNHRVKIAQSGSVDTVGGQYDINSNKEQSAQSPGSPQQTETNSKKLVVDSGQEATTDNLA